MRGREKAIGILEHDLGVAACYDDEPDSEEEIRAHAERLADAILALPVVVSDEMVERGCRGIYPNHWPLAPNPDGMRRDVRAALEAALNPEGL